MKLSELFQSSDNHKKPNLLFIITDQERQLQHYPADFLSKHLPALTRLKQSGISFTNAFTPTCLCSPSQATMLTSSYPSLHGVTSTGSPQPIHSLLHSIPNLATVCRKAGYSIVEWQGKWHLGGTSPLEYGFTGWSPPDAGNYLTINDTLGGGTPNNDGRFLENVLNFLKSHQDSQEPWCLIVSFVNPHDVYVSQYDVLEAGYSKSDLHSVRVPLASNCMEDLQLQNKPRAQQGMHWKNVAHKNSMQEYCNFYAYLQTLVDKQILTILDKLNDCNQTSDTIVFRFADHGEQALSHGLVEKFYNVYNESIRIPFIVSNPRVWYSKEMTNDAMVSLLDLLPTIADLLGVLHEFENYFHGKSLVSLLDYCNDSTGETLVQTSSDDKDDATIHFTYNDIACENAPSTIRCIVTRDYKYAVYYNEDGSDADWELYDLRKDSEENVNVAGQQDYASIQFVLEETLQVCMRNYKTLPTTFEWPPKQTQDSRGGPAPPSM